MESRAEKRALSQGAIPSRTEPSFDPWAELSPEHKAGKSGLSGCDQI